MKKLILMAAIFGCSSMAMADEIACFKKNGELAYENHGPDIGVSVDPTGNHVIVTEIRTEPGIVRDRKVGKVLVRLTNMSCIIKP